MNLQSIAFAQIQKVDEATQMVYGRAVQEVADRSKEIFDYASSKPYFEAWSKSQSEASMGKSHGNIRAMHAPKAVGIVVPGGMVFHDDECAIDYAVKVSDPAEFGKCLDGTYTGFSIGGSYVKKWKDPANPELTRYTANPSETSLVDRPCVGTATFTAVKADGTEMQKTFKVAEPTAPSRKSMIEFLAKKDNATEDLGMLGDAEVLAKYTEQRAADQAAIDAGPVMNVVVGDPAELEQFATLLTQKNMTLGDVVKALKPIIDPYAPSAADIVLRAKQMAKSLVTPQAVEAAARKLCEAAGKDPDSRKQAGDYSVQAWMDFRKQAEDQLKKASGGDSWKAHVVASDRALRDEALGITPEKLEAEVIKQAAGAEATDAHREAALVELRKAENVALADLQKRSLPQPLQRVLFGKGMFADPINKKYPLDTVDQVKAAWAYVNKAGTAKLYDAEALTALKATVADAWKAKLGGEPPVEKDAEAEMQKIEGELNKGMYTVSSLARILDDLSYVCSSCDYEAASEGDGSAIPGRLAMCLKDLGSICVDMCAEEVGELTAPKEAMKATYPDHARSRCGPWRSVWGQGRRSRQGRRGRRHAEGAQRRDRRAGQVRSASQGRPRGAREAHQDARGSARTHPRQRRAEGGDAWAADQRGRSRRRTGGQAGAQGGWQRGRCGDGDQGLARNGRRRHQPGKRIREPGRDQACAQ